MKEELRPASSNHQRKLMVTRSLFAHPTLYVVLLLLTYFTGYLSRSPSPPPPPPLPPPLPPLEQQEPQLSPSTTSFHFINLPTQLDNFRVTTPCAKPLPPELVRPTILDRVFSGSSPYTNFPPAHAGPLLKEKRIKGWGSYGVVFENLIYRVKPRVIIEVGTFLGASTLHMSNLTRELGLQTQIICVDDFRGWPGFRDRFKDIKTINGDVLLLYQFMQNVVHNNATEQILPLPFSTGSGLEKLCEWGVRGDLIEIDAGHDFLSAWGDINRAYRILRPGGILFGHDYFTAADNRGVRRAVNLFAAMNNLKVTTDGQHWILHNA